MSRYATSFVFLFNIYDNLKFPLQQYFICDWWYNVDCSANPSFYGLNEFIYQEQPEGKKCKSLFCSNEWKTITVWIAEKLDILLWINCILNFSQITKANFTLAQFWICEATK